MIIITKFLIGDYVFLKHNPSSVFQINYISINDKNEITYSYNSNNGIYIYGKEEDLVKLCTTC
jgi:hypothetical protein